MAIKTQHDFPAGPQPMALVWLQRVNVMEETKGSLALTLKPDRHNRSSDLGFCVHGGTCASVNI